MVYDHNGGASKFNYGSRKGLLEEKPPKPKNDGSDSKWVVYLAIGLLIGSLAFALTQSLPMFYFPR